MNIEATAPTGNATKTLVSILNWNGTVETLACLNSLDRTNAEDFHFVVLDNGSTENPASLFSQLVPPIEYLALPENTGFTGGHNHVMRIALDRGFGSVLLLNNDCKITLNDIRELVLTLNQDPLVAAVSPMLFRDDKSRKPMMVAGWIDWATHRSVRPNSPQAKQPEGAPTFLVGTAILFRCDALKKIGLLDDRYFAYYEDNDISVRIDQHGFRSVYCSRATCLHDFRSLHEYSAHALYLMTRNSWLFWQSHTPDHYRAGLRRNLFASAMYDLALLQKNHSNHNKTQALINGLWDGLHGVSGAPRTVQTSPNWFQFLVQIRPYTLFRILSRWSGAGVMPLGSK